jgi:hypothetical protein
MYGVIDLADELRPGVRVQAMYQGFHDQSASDKLMFGELRMFCLNTWVVFNASEGLAKHKNTISATEVLPVRMDSMVHYFNQNRGRLAENHDALNAAEISGIEASHIIVKAVENNILPGSKISAVLDEWNNPTSEDEPRNLYSLSNAFTVVNKTRSVEQTNNTGMYDFFVVSALDFINRRRQAGLR